MERKPIYITEQTATGPIHSFARDASGNVIYDEPLFELPTWQPIKLEQRPMGFYYAERVLIGGRFLAALWNQRHATGWTFYVGRARGGYRMESSVGSDSLTWDDARVKAWLDIEALRYETKVAENPEYIRADVPPPVQR